MRAWTFLRRELLLVGALMIAALIELSLAPLPESDKPLLVPLGIVLPLSLLLRIRVPLLVLAVNLAGWIVIDLIGIETTSGESADPVILGLTLGIAVYSVGAHTRPGVPAWGGLALVAALVVLGALSEDQSDFGDVVFFSVVFGGVWLAGRAIRRRRLREDELVVERDAKAVAAVAEERTRIARELHDVVAHAVSVIVLQARGGRRVLDDDPADAREAFDTIEATGKQALVEMRRLLGLLRADDEELALAPQPSLGQLDRLAAQVREAGLPVEIAIEGDPVELPPGVDVSAYRIVQEALTNALRHAGPARAHVLVRYGTDELELEITDDGPGASNGDGTGHGLLGIRERVAVYGGDLRAGVRAEGGFSLRARLPLVGG
jgi:signal transduction histidine kinase